MTKVEATIYALAAVIALQACIVASIVQVWHWPSADQPDQIPVVPLVFIPDTWVWWAHLLSVPVLVWLWRRTVSVVALSVVVLVGLPVWIGVTALYMCPYAHYLIA